MSKETESKTIVEINGVKLEVDLRYARRVEELRIGSRVKVLTKNYNDWSAHAGVIVGFEPFPDRPTIIIAYIKADYANVGLHLVHWHKDNKDAQVVACDDDDFSVSKAEVLGWFDREKTKFENQIKEIEAKRKYFLDRFKSYFPEKEIA